MEPGGSVGVEAGLGLESKAGTASGYRAHLDGLRVVAVYLVVAFHARLNGFSGGFIGVDVFFVLSGYLVTRLLLRDLDGSGSIRFRRFYARRFRRLLPAAAVVLLVSAVLYSVVASPVEVAEAEGGFRAAFLYVTNWYFISQSKDYFVADIATNPVLQFWSLAVEEQFYLVWPVLLTGLFALTRRFGTQRQRATQALVALAATASLVWAWSLQGSDPARSFYGTDARAYQLLAGALVALSPGLVKWAGRKPAVARAAAAAGLVTIVVAATSWIDFPVVQRGLVATLATVVVIVTLEAAGGGIARRGLSLAPMVYLGRISYGTYLWHWPVILIIAETAEVSPLSTFVLTVLVATGLASLSYQIMEHPIRISGVLDRHRGPVIAVGLAISAFGAFAIIPAVLAPAPTTATPTNTDLATSGFTPVPDLDYQAIRNDIPIFTSCFDAPESACTIVKGTGQHVLLIGDSHAATLAPALAIIAKQNNLTLSVAVRAGCPWQRELFRVPGGGVPQPVAECRRHKDDVYDRVVPALDPDVIIVMNNDYPRRNLPFLGPDGNVLEPGPELDAWLEKTTTDSLAQLAAENRSIVIVEPIPNAGKGTDPVTCLSSAVVVEECRYVVSASPSPLEQTYRRIDRENNQVWSVDLDRLVCPYLPICDPILGGTVVQFDGSHLTNKFSTALAPDLAKYLTDNGIVAKRV